MNKEEMIALARRLLDLPENAELHERDTGSDALCVYQPGRGGPALIIDPDGSVLYGGSDSPFDELFADFKRGLRTPPEVFEEDE